MNPADAEMAVICTVFAVSFFVVLGFCLAIEDIIKWIEMRKIMLENERTMQEEQSYRAWRYHE